MDDFSDIERPLIARTRLYVGLCGSLLGQGIEVFYRITILVHTLAMAFVPTSPSSTSIFPSPPRRLCIGGAVTSHHDARSNFLIGHIRGTEKMRAAWSSQRLRSAYTF